MPSISVVIPAFNEERRLPQTLNTILAYFEANPPSFLEILVVDDGSRDATAAVVEGYGGRVRLLANPGNRGKGYSVRHGMLEAVGDWALFTDADLSAPIEDVHLLIDAAREQEAAIAIGSRAVDRRLVGVHQPYFRELSGRAFNLLMQTVTGLPFRDTQCGFKLYRRDAAQAVFSRQTLDGFSFDVENLVIARELGLKAIEVAVHWNNVEGTTVGTLQGLKSFADLMQIRKNRAAGLYRQT